MMRSIFSLIILTTVLLSCQSEKHDSHENGFMVNTYDTGPGTFSLLFTAEEYVS